MKILWIVNKVCGDLHVELFGKPATGGLWLEATLKSAKLDHEIEIAVVNVGGVSKTREFIAGNVTYYTIPGIANEHYDYASAEAKGYWKEIINRVKPDLIELWGTEFPYSIPALDIAKDIPVVVFVQGILDSIAKYYTAGLTDKDLSKALTIRDIFTKSSIRKVQEKYVKRSIYDNAIVTRSNNVIVENLWAEAYYRKICPELRVFKCPISISTEFETAKWTSDKVHPHTLMCSAADYPIKGLHMLLKALAIVRETYPDVTLNIPGTPLRKLTNLKDKLKQTGYEKFIRNQIDEYNLNGVVKYIGRLTAREMAAKMAESNAFIMCSAIENHSSTLKEAMTVGVPCIASYVGGVPEYAFNERNCLLYRFEDYEVLALNIIRLFESKDLCEKLSMNARQDMKDSREKNDVYAITKSIYQELIGHNEHIQ